MKENIGFDGVYARWLSENLHRLKEASVKLLTDLDKESYKFVRLSTVTQFDFEKKLKLFRSRANNIYRGLPMEKITIFEKAMTVTNDKGIMLDIDTLTKAITVAKNFEKQERGKKNEYGSITLDKWDEAWKKD